MSYDSRESSGAGGEPFECYRFAQGARLWLFTSADREMVIPAGTFQPEVISRGEQDHSQEEIAGDLEIHLARTNPVVARFIPFIPSSATNVTVYRGHRGEEANAQPIFIGTARQARFEGSEAILVCAPISQAFVRAFPSLLYQTTCPWALYGTGCGVDKSAFRDDILVTTVSGFDVVSNDFLLHPTGWYTNGWLERADGERRFIVDHVGDTVTLMSPFQDLLSLETLGAFAGCDRTEATCAAKFANLDRHLGFARIPKRNPHTGRIA